MKHPSVMMVYQSRNAMDHISDVGDVFVNHYLFFMNWIEMCYKFLQLKLSLSSLQVNHDSSKYY